MKGTHKMADVPLVATDANGITVKGLVSTAHQTDPNGQGYGNPSFVQYWVTIFTPHEACTIDQTVLLREELAAVTSASQAIGLTPDARILEQRLNDEINEMRQDCATNQNEISSNETSSGADLTTGSNSLPV